MSLKQGAVEVAHAVQALPESGILDVYTSVRTLVPTVLYMSGSCHQSCPWRFLSSSGFFCRAFLLRESCVATTAYFTHHLRRISNAIVLTDARLLNEAAATRSDSADDVTALLRPHSPARVRSGRGWPRLPPRLEGP